MNPILKRFLQLGFLILLQMVCLFAAAGRLNWGEGWAYMGIYVGFIAVNALVMLPKGTALIAERSRVLEGSRGWDRVIMGLYTLAGPAMLVVAGLDEHFGWTPRLGLAIQMAGALFMVLGYGLFSWGMAVNAFFAATVRIQEERGHQVVAGGPYRIVRHLGYVGIIIFSLATPLLLDSLWALIPALVLIGVLIARTALEDRTLQAELAGYKEYAQQTRYRLLPGIW
jgi:protein-S-isoprenylcysteine O-methyltransferase Ste14